MGFNDLNAYVPTHKVYDRTGNIVPPVEHSEGVRPSIEARPASWLPVQFWDKHYENWNVVMTGKAVAFDPDGHLMPAQYGLTGQSVVYTADDVAAGTIDVATGLAVTTAKTVVLSNLTGERHATWTAATAGTGAITSGFMGRFGESYDDASVKYPIGVAPQPYLQWAGGDGFNPSSYAKHNYNMQHQTAILCDYALRMPVIPGQAASETVDGSVTGSPPVFGTQATHTRDQCQLNARYSATSGTVPILNSYPVIGLALDNVQVAKNTSRTTISLASDNANDDVSDVLVYEKSAVSAVKSAGDFFVDYVVGMIFIYSADGATVPTSISGAAGTVSVTYYHYGATASVLSKFACVLSDSSVLKRGQFLKVGTDSNLVPISGTEDFKTIVAQVIGFESHPRDALDRVRTAYDPALETDGTGAMANATAASSTSGQLDQMPGSANGGYPDLIHYAGAADRIAILNLVSR